MDPKDLDIATFKDHFDEGQFIYGPSPPEVRDKRIASAILEMQAVIKPSLYPKSTLLLAKLYLTAHFLYLDLDASKSGGQPSSFQTSRSADGLSESFSVPESLTKGNNSFYSSTYYGQKWLALTPSRVFYVGCVKGRTLP